MKLKKRYNKKILVFCKINSFGLAIEKISDVVNKTTPNNIIEMFRKIFFLFQV